MQILLLTLYFYPDAGANSAIMTELAEEFAARGHKVTVVTAFPHYAGNVVGSGYKGKIIQREQVGSIDVIRTYLYTSPKKDRFWVRFLNYISFNLLSTLAGIFSGPQDIIFAPSPPLTIGLSAFIIGLFKRITYIYNVQDINPDVLIKLGILKNPIGIVVSRWLELFVYRHANHITVLSEGFRKNLLKKQVPKEKLTVIPNFIDIDFIRPLERQNSFRDKFGLRDKFVVLYAGNLGHSQNLEHVLECASMIIGQDDIRFLIVGNGSCKPSLLETAKILKVENVLFLPFQPRQDVPQIYASADISLITLKKGIALDSVPSKAYTIMASGRPVIAAVDSGSDVWNLIKDADCGLCVPPESPEALLTAINELFENVDLRNLLSRNGRMYVEKHYTREIVASQYNQLLEKIL